MYKVVTTEKFDKTIRKMDRHTQKIIISWIKKNLVGCENPRVHGKALTANRRGQWRYRIGDYRILADIRDNELILILVEAGHRKKIYL